MSTPAPARRAIPRPLLAPWAITAEGLELVIGVWSRGHLFADVVARARAQRGDAPMENGATYTVQDGVAVIPVCGPLFRHATLMTEVSGATSYEAVGRDLGEALADPDVRAVVLCIDSPGGVANGCGELAARIRAADAVKPVYAYAEGDCCSGAYWLASAAREIIAAPAAEVGCIGVRIGMIDDSGAQEKLGVREIEIISSQSPGKRGTPVDDEVTARVQRRADDLAEVFISDVARYRGVSTDKVLSDFGDPLGDVLIGRKAVAAGLADRLGSLDDLLLQLRAPAAQRTDMSTTPPTPPAATPPPTQDRYAGLHAQVAAMTGKTDPAEQQEALAGLQLRVTQAEAEAREAWIAVARARGVPPTAMLGWEHMPLASLKKAVGHAPVLQPHQPGEVPAGYTPAAGSSSAEPHGAQGGPVPVSALDAYLLQAGGVAPDKMADAKATGVKVATERMRAGQPDWLLQLGGGGR